MRMSFSEQDYISLFDTRTEAIEFEGQALSIGVGLLPEIVRAVKDGDQDPTEEYWAWLCSQVEAGDCDRQAFKKS